MGTITHEPVDPLPEWQHVVRLGGQCTTQTGHPLGRAEWSLSRVEQPLTITANTIDDKPCRPVVEK